MGRIGNEHDVEKKPDRKALLDFYMDSGLTHVTMFVAVMFGLFTVLSLLERVRQYCFSFVLLSFVYVVLFLGGLYTLLKFSYYSKISSRILWSLGKDEPLCSLREDENIRQDRKSVPYFEYPYSTNHISPLLRWIYKRISVARVLRLVILFYFLIGIFSYLAIFLIN